MCANSLIRRLPRGPIALAALTLVAAPVAARAEAPAETGRVEDTFPSGGEKIAVERYQPAAAGQHPAILLLPAIDGLDQAHGDLYRRAARRYANKGYVVLLVNYFDRTPAGQERILDPARLGRGVGPCGGHCQQGQGDQHGRPAAEARPNRRGVFGGRRPGAGP